MSATRVRHELVAWSLPAEMIPEALRRRAPDVDTDCYLAVRCLLPSALAAAARASVNAGCEVTPLSVLVPCRAAMYAKFPLHGTYFQTNELFLDARTAAAPAMVPARRLEFAPTVSVLLGSSVASICRGMSRAEVAAAFAHRAVCVRSWDADGGGRPRPLPKWACPFAPKANTLGPAPGEERAFVESHPGTGDGFLSTPFLSSLAAGSREAARDGDSAPPGGGSASRGTAGSDPRESAPPANAENAFESDEDAMDERWDLFLDRQISGPTSPRKPPRDGERAENVDARPDGVLASAPTRRHPGWNVGVLAAFAARRRAAAETARKKKRAARDGSGPSGSGSGSAERRKREPNIQTFFSPAA